MSNPIVVVDEGSNQVKTVWFNAEKNQIEYHIMPSLVIRKKATDEEGYILDSAYEIGAKKYYSVVDNDHEGGLPTMGYDYQISKANMALTHEALRVNFADQTVDVYVTLPIGQFFLEDNTRHTDRIDEKKALLSDTPVNINGKPMATIASLDVMPEGIPVWFDLLFSDDIQFQNKFENVEKVLIVDIGGTTFDMTLVTGNGRILAKEGVEVGCFDIAKNLRGVLPDALSVSNKAIEGVMRTKQFRGKDVTAELIEASDPVAEHIYQKMKTFEKDPQSLDYVVYAGGGANLLGDQLEQYYGGKTLIPNQPELSVARGILKRKLVARMQAEQA